MLAIQPANPNRAYLTSFKNTATILSAIRAAPAPPRFTQNFLEGLGYQSTNDLDDEIVNALDDAREAAGLSNAELARAIQVEPATIRRLLPPRSPTPRSAHLLRWPQPSTSGMRRHPPPILWTPE